MAARASSVAPSGSAASTSQPAPSAPPPSAGVGALAQLPLLSFLTASPGPALVLPLSPLAGALRSRQLASPLKTPLWSAHAPEARRQPDAARGTGRPAEKRSRTGDSATRASSTSRDAGHDVVRGIEELNVETPLGIPNATSSSAAGDYFSLVAPDDEDVLHSSGTSVRPGLPSAAVPSSSASSSSASSSDALLASTSIEGASTPLTPVDGAESDDDILIDTPTATSGAPWGSDPFAALGSHLTALNPVFRNEAWRSLEHATRRNSSARAIRSVGTARSGGVATSSRSSLARHGKRRRSSADGADDALMGGLPAVPDSGAAASGGRSTTPLGTVKEEDYGMETEDEGSGFETDATDDVEEDGNWRAAYAFLTPDDQLHLLGFLLDLIEDLDIGGISSSVPRSSAPYMSPSAVSPTSTPAVVETPRWSSAYDSTTPTSSSPAHQDGIRANFSLSPSAKTARGSSAPPDTRQLVQTCRLDDYVISATVVPMDGAMRGSAHGFVILSMAPPAPPVTAVHTWPPRSSHRGSTPSSTSGTAPAPPTAAKAAELGQIYQPPSAETSTKQPSLALSLPGVPPAGPLLATEDPWVRSLGDSEMGRRIRRHAWHETPLGPISGWQPELKVMVASILASPFRECILWGPDMILIYNDHYIETAGDKHPGLLGLPARIGWREIWDGLNAVAQRSLAGETCYFHEHFLAMERIGFAEETYHTFSYAPFYDSTGNVLGILNLSIEATATVVAARRLATTRDLVQMTSLARTVEDFAETALKAFANNPYDLPFVQLFTVEEVNNKPSRREVRLGYDRSTRTIIKLTNRGSTGIPQDHPFHVQEALVDVTPPMSRQSSSSASTSTGTGSTATAMDLRERLDAASMLSPAAPVGSPATSSASNASTASATGHSGAVPQWAWPFEEACLKRDAILVEDLGPLAESLDRSRGWSYPARQAVVIPIFVEIGQTIPSAVVVFGINAMSRYTSLMEVFFNLVARHVAIGLFAVLAAEQDRHRADELMKLDRAKTSFFSSVSHELRTPLTLILGPLEDLLTGAERHKLDRDQREKLVLVQRHANRLLTLVNKLLDFSSIEGGRMSFKFRPVQIGPLTRDIAVLFRDAIERTGITYTVQCDDDPSECLPIYLSPDLWEKIVLNLISNALKYSLQGHIKVTLRSTRAEAVFSVSDTGIGIPQAELGKIFDRFHRIEANSRMATGTGIGLALTLELVKLIGGQLEVESELGKGSTFTIRLQRGHTHLPIEQVDHTPEDTTLVAQFQNRNLAVVDEAASWRYNAEAPDTLDLVPLSSSSSVASGTDSSEHGASSGSNSGSGSGEDYLGSADVLSLKNRTIVLVDDSRDLRTYIASLLLRNFTVVQFGDPREALEYINKTPPSLVLTDAMMPYITGMELTTALRRNPHTALIPIIMVSAQAGNEARAEALEGGVDDYLVKPFQARELLARVRVHLQLGLMRIELEKRVDERTRALIESEARNRGLAERYSMLSTVSPVGVVQIDAKGEPIFCNPRWFEITGMSLGRPLAEWVDQIVPEDLRKVEYAWKAATGGTTTEAAERQFRFKNGRWAQLEIRASTEVGLPDGYVGALTDITRQKELEMLHIREVEQRALDAEENRRNTEMFLDMSSHELRNPLSGVWQNAEVVSASLEKYVDLLDSLRQGREVSPKLFDSLYNEMLENVEAVESIILCASHQGRIADDILNVSKLNMGLLSINLAPTHIYAAVQEVVKTFEAQSHQQQIQLSIERGDSLAALGVEWIVADSGRIKQILFNFVGNALKYTADSTQKRIVIHIEVYNGPPPTTEDAIRIAAPNQSFEVPANSVWCIIGVQDSGRGLSPEQLKLLFARFSQANPKSDQYGGSGLGLYVSKKLVELHSGFIEVRTGLGVGSTFSFAIPAQRISPPSSPVSTPAVSALGLLPAARSTRRPSTAAAPEAAATPTGDTEMASSTPPPEEPQVIRVLVVEDNLINQRVLLRQLKTAGYEVTVANHGREALDILVKDAELSDDGQEPHISAVLMDLQMPVMGGLEAIKELRQRERSGEFRRRYPVCAVTGNARDAQQAECLEAGFDDVATKPYKINDVLGKITKMTGLPPPQRK
ncbi:uncharacterized protein JCM10292_004800 [Rhodotorula paludigena]|uniref:uncharacterized protein n=1 Tax=Rhodotorula paludigena TaxID=86838 RepID=UPI003178F443